MNLQTSAWVLTLPAVILGAAWAAAAAIDLPELQSPHFTEHAAEGLGMEAGVCRRDPSDVIQIGSRFYVWYTKVLQSANVFMYPSGYSGAIWYATSSDGVHWREAGEALGKGTSGSFDDSGVFTPNILVAGGKYFLFYTAVHAPMSTEAPTTIGVASANSPTGPWTRTAGNPVLRPSTNPAQFDSFRVDDACLLIRDGRYWLYYKGRQQGHSPRETKWGLAIAGQPAGPYRKNPANPVLGSGHEVLVWPQRAGVAALVGPVGPEKNTIQFAGDGIHFQVVARFTDPPMAPGGYRPDAFTGAKYAAGMPWGIAMKNGPNPYLVRFECAFTTPKEK